MARTRNTRPLAEPEVPVKAEEDASLAAGNYPQMLPPVKLGEEDLSDLVLIVGDQEFHVHKMALACRSKVFKSMLYGDNSLGIKETQVTDNKIEIKGVSPKVFKAFLQILYKGEINPDENFLLYPEAYNHDIEKTSDVSANYRPKVMTTDKFNYVYSVLKEFWKNAEELLEIAERFDVLSSIRVFIGNIIATDVCKRDKCFYCINNAFFAKEHDLRLFRWVYHPKWVHDWIEGVGKQDVSSFKNVRASLSTGTVLGSISSEIASKNE